MTRLLAVKYHIRRPAFQMLLQAPFRNIVQKQTILRRPSGYIQDIVTCVAVIYSQGIYYFSINQEIRNNQVGLQQEFRNAFANRKDFLKISLKCHDKLRALWLLNKQRSCYNVIQCDSCYNVKGSTCCVYCK